MHADVLPLAGSPPVCQTRSVSGNDVLLGAITLQLANLSRSVAEFQAWNDKVTASTLAGQMYLQNLTLWIQNEVSCSVLSLELHATPSLLCICSAFLRRTCSTCSCMQNALPHRLIVSDVPP